MDYDEESGEAIGARVLEALSLQAKLQLDLFRLELERELKIMVRMLIPFAVGIPLISLGYVFGSFAGALAIASVLGPAAGAAIVAALNLLLGALVLWLGSRARSRQRSSSSPPTRWINDDA